MITTHNINYVESEAKLGTLNGGIIVKLASLVAQLIKNLPEVQETRVRSLGWEDPLEKEWQPTPVSLPGRSHGQRSLVG